MKNYTITVNGTAYNVTVEEGVSTGTAMPAAVAPAPVTQAAPVSPAPAAQTAVEEAPAPVSAPQAAGSAGSVVIEASVPGKVYKVEASVGQAVKAGDAVVILEAMKMEIPIVAPQDGTVASINVAAGEMVEAGDTLSTMN